MKIIVMDSANVRIEVLNVPDHMIDEDIEQFLAEHDYSLNNISWMAAPIDFVPVQFHEYGICHSDGEELHFVRDGKLKDFSIYDSVQEVKQREQKELAERLRLRGEKVDDGYEWHFEGECPIVAGLQETEYGYQSANEMASVAYDASEYGLGTLRIEQDKEFQPCKLADIEDEELQLFLSRLYDKD